MTQHNDKEQDPLIDEVRERRRRLFAHCGNDFHKLGKLIQQRQAEHPGKVVDRRKHKIPNR